MEQPCIEIAASYTIGTHILPGEPIQVINQVCSMPIKLAIETSDKIVRGVKEGRYPMGLIETPVFDDTLTYSPWMKDELVLCSSFQMDAFIEKETLTNCKILCRNTDSLTRQVISRILSKHDLSYDSFGTSMEIDNDTTAIQSIKWSKPNRERPTIAIVSQLAIMEELMNKKLYQSRIKEVPLFRKFYLVYVKNHINEEKLMEVKKYLTAWGKKLQQEHKEMTDRLTA